MGRAHAGIVALSNGTRGISFTMFFCGEEGPLIASVQRADSLTMISDDAAKLVALKIERQYQELLPSAEVLYQHNVAAPAASHLRVKQPAVVR